MRSHNGLKRRCGKQENRIDTDGYLWRSTTFRSRHVCPYKRPIGTFDNLDSSRYDERDRSTRSLLISRFIVISRTNLFRWWSRYLVQMIFSKLRLHIVHLQHCDPVLTNFHLRPPSHTYFVFFIRFWTPRTSSPLRYPDMRPWGHLLLIHATTTCVWWIWPETGAKIP